MRLLFILALLAAFGLSVFAQDWRKMTEAELRTAVPERAPVIKEQIETEYRTASGLTDGKSKMFGVVIITAGYEADGKYTHYFHTDKPLTVGDLPLKADDYIFGYQRLDAETLRVTFYHADDGELVGAIKARVEKAKGPIYSFLIDTPAGRKGRVYIGRFSFDYTLD